MAYAGFVRGHSFHGKRVFSFTEACERYGEFRIVLSFGTRLREVLDLLYGYAERYELYLPDLPVAGETVFDKGFYNAHYEDFVRALTRLSDDESRRIFASLIYYKLTGRIQYLRDAYSTEASYDACIPYERLKESIDAGAYDGDTASVLLKKAPQIQKIIAIEPDIKNYKRLCKRLEREAIAERISSHEKPRLKREAETFLIFSFE